MARTGQGTVTTFEVVAVEQIEPVQARIRYLYVEPEMTPVSWNAVLSSPRSGSATKPVPSTLRSIAYRVSFELLSVHVTAMVVGFVMAAEAPVGGFGAVDAVSVAEYAEQPPALQARTRYEYVASSDPVASVWLTTSADGIVAMLAKLVPAAVPRSTS